MLLVAGPAAAAALDETTLKAEFLRHFIEFVNWPVEGDVLSVCLLGRNSPGAAFDTLNGYPVRKSVLAIRRPLKPEALKDCAVVYLPGAERDALDSVLAQLRDKPVLLVADIEGAAQLGASLSLHYVDGGRIGFDANFTAAKAAGLKMSSRLSQLARRVH